VGVTIFFVISGFLLYRPFVLAQLQEERLPRVRSYAVRRFLRIVPCYWVALTVVALVLGLDDVFTASGIPTYYGFLQAYSDDTFAGGIGQAWTLCVEVAFYAFLPVWAVFMRAVQRPARRALMCGRSQACSTSSRWAWRWPWRARGCRPGRPYRAPCRCCADGRPRRGWWRRSRSRWRRC
jgi:peptidoglycan/LPS O-acetylase OafA/YrhL